VKTQLPEDLIMARTSDQPRQVTENVDLFMDSLYEAIILVVIVSLIGFWDWRSALLMGLAIPITLFITFGMSRALGIDLQQVSIATLIIALGLLVDVRWYQAMRLRIRWPADFRRSSLHGLVQQNLSPRSFSLRSPISSLTCHSLLYREHGRILIQSADRPYLFAGSCVDRGHDVHSLPRLFFVEGQASAAH